MYYKYIIAESKLKILILEEMSGSRPTYWYKIETITIEKTQQHNVYENLKNNILLIHLDNNSLKIQSDSRNGQVT